ncbi:hypothetical protein [Pectobacterium betavasculorum]|uniref:Type I restriction enzyme R protein N-terminal domain-containing protein n=1 Tax=Pectobacterium betavasculorum TaxID=55207 RepID=A0ABR4UU68_9GAMM|nr:hypothetical protein [Pectobacterium betavasculorum]KFX11374.1 hypothetical protein JV35_20980 [Pectobacterium betavasculorum]
MDFLNRIKKEMSEGIVKAILENYGYRVIDTGIEKVIREISFLPKEAYVELEFPQAMRKLPDYVVMNKNQDKKLLIDVKYRSMWDGSLLLDKEVKEQVELFRKIILVVINGQPPAPPVGRTSHNPIAYIRCVVLAKRNDCLYVKKRQVHADDDWIEINEKNTRNFNWFATHTLGEVFPLITDEYNNEIIKLSVEALSGIINDKKS